MLISNTAISKQVLQEVDGTVIRTLTTNKEMRVFWLIMYLDENNQIIELISMKVFIFTWEWTSNNVLGRTTFLEDLSTNDRSTTKTLRRQAPTLKTTRIMSTKKSNKFLTITTTITTDILQRINGRITKTVMADTSTKLKLSLPKNCQNNLDGGDSINTLV